MHDRGVSPLPARRPAVFLDRDGTLNREVDYLTEVADFELLPGAAEALRDLQAAGYLLVVVTNQSAIARGMMDAERLDEIHAEMTRLLSDAGVHLDHVAACPHHPDTGPCTCRKPQPGMLLEATRTLGIDLTTSYVVGDSLRDLQAGEAIGVRGILVATGKGAGQEHAARTTGRAVEPFVPDLRAAADWILARGA